MSRLEELNRIIKSIDYNQLWDGFSKSKYALYNEKHFYLDDNSGINLDSEKEGSFFIGETDERFNGNTVISINDNCVAIWNEKTIPDGTDDRRLASYIIHEMFHCFQLSYGEKRFPNELLNIYYPVTIENIMLRSLERQFLLSASTENEKSKRQSYINLFFTARKKREQLIGDYLNYEKAIETGEGTAMYVEYSALKQLVGDDALSLTEFVEGFSEIKESNLNIRQSTYHQGLLLCIIADAIIPNWKNDIISSNLYLSDYIYKSLKINIAEIEDVNVSIKDIELCISNWVKQRDKVFDEFEMNQSFNVIEENFKITAFDPMNIVKRNQEVIHKNFLKIKIGDSDKVINGPVKAIIGDNIFDVKRIVW